MTNPTFSACVEHNVNSPPPGVDPLAAAAILGGVLGGGAMVWAGASIDPNPVGTVEARQVADAYNRDLRQRWACPPGRTASTSACCPTSSRAAPG